MEEDASCTVFAIGEVPARNGLCDFGGRKVRQSVCRGLPPRGGVGKRHIRELLSLPGEEALLGIEVGQVGHGLTRKGRGHAVYRLRIKKGEHKWIRGYGGRRNDGASCKELADDFGVIVPDSEDNGSTICGHVCSDKHYGNLCCEL